MYSCLRATLSSNFHLIERLRKFLNENLAKQMFPDQKVVDNMLYWTTVCKTGEENPDK